MRRGRERYKVADKLDNGQLAGKKKAGPKFDYEIEWACKCYGLSSASVVFLLFFIFGFRFRALARLNWRKIKENESYLAFVLSRCV